MKLCRTHLVRACLFLLAAVPAYCQRGTFGIDVGQTSDKFDSLSSVGGLVVGIDGQLTVIKGKETRPSIVGGGEIRSPSDTGNHAREYAVFGGLHFQARGLLIGFNVQLRQITLPTANVDNQFFARDRMRLLEVPLVINYKFGPNKRAFVEAQGAPEFTPHWHRPSSNQVALPNPRLDHGYFIRGTIGYTFAKWYYVKATYENRYFKFVPDLGNPNNLYNWKTNLISGGIGFTF
ncbi:MAG TPA: hypothetical protein VMS18_30235 [Candidatus Binatia bacterium]|nr:hypothetical protein [Candidatus Binatia bacterium]